MRYDHRDSVLVATGTHHRLAGLADTLLLLLEAADDPIEVRDRRDAVAIHVARTSGARFSFSDREAWGRGAGEHQRENNRSRGQFPNPFHDVLLCFSNQAGP